MGGMKMRYRANKKYRFSETWRFGDWNFLCEKEYEGKYGCQVFDENYNYIEVLIADSSEEINKLQAEYGKKDKKDE